MSNKETESANTENQEGSSEPLTQTETSDTSWKDSLPEDLRDNPSIRDIKDVDSLAKSFVHAQSMMGKDKVVIPGPNASDEERSDFYSRLGRSEKYSIPKPDMPEGVEFDQELSDKMLGIMHKAGLSDSQAKAIYDSYNEYEREFHSKTQKDMETRNGEWKQQIKTDWGKAYDTELAKAQNAMTEFGGDELKQWMNKTGEGDNPLLLKFFAKVGGLISEPNVSTSERSNFGVYTPGAAQEEIANLKLDKDFQSAYMDSAHPAHKDALDKMTKLFVHAYPKEKDE